MPHGTLVYCRGNICVAVVWIERPSTSCWRVFLLGIDMLDLDLRGGKACCRQFGVGSFSFISYTFTFTYTFSSITLYI